VLPITRLAFLLVRSQAVAEDLAHHAFVRLYEHRDDVYNPPGFVRTAVVRLAIRWQERARLERDRLAVVAGEDRGVDGPEIDEMWQAIGRLRPDWGTVLLLPGGSPPAAGSASRRTRRARTPASRMPAC
jgi:DNA-directed RNA polymerase specialized sigma24 family protein